MILQDINDSIEIKLSGTVATNQLDFVSDWVDVTATAYSPGQSNGTTNNTTAVTVVAAPASSTTRKVRRLVVYNKDTASAILTIQLNDNSTIRVQTKATLSSGDTLEYVEGIGFRVLNSSGAIKQTTSVGTDTIPATQVTTDSSNRFVTDTQITNFQSAYNNSILANGGATVAVTFATSKYYGTATSPLSGGSITYNFTNAVAGSKAIIFHNAGAEPTYPVGTYKRFGTYVPSALNILTFEFIDSNTILLDVAYSSTAGLQPEVVTWLSKGGVATGFILTALNQFLLNIASMRSRLLRMNLIFGETFSSCFIPIIVNDDGSGTPLGSALDTNVNWVSADWTNIGATGGLTATSNSTKYINTSFVPNDIALFGLNDASCGTYLTNVSTNNAGTILFFGLGTTQICGNSQSNNAQIALNNANVSTTSGGATAKVTILNRSSSTTLDMYLNGSKTSFASTSTSKGTSALIYGNYNNSPNTASRSVGGYFIGKSIDATQEALLRGEWNTLMTKLARG